MEAAQAEAVRDAIMRVRFRVASEDDLQDAICTLLNRGGVPELAAVREHRLDAQSRVDLLTAGGVGIEVKTAGSVGNVRRQVARYLEHPDLRGLVLATTRRRHAQLEADLAGYPIPFLVAVVALV